jgi:hypothetical protein
MSLNFDIVPVTFNLWRCVYFDAMNDTEIAELLLQRFPLMKQIIPDSISKKNGVQEATIHFALPPLLQKFSLISKRNRRRPHFQIQQQLLPLLPLLHQPPLLLLLPPTLLLLHFLSIHLVIPDFYRFVI